MAVESSLIRYFNAVSLNKIKDVKLKEAELKLDDERRKVLTKFWKDKFDILDDLVQINVKTPAYLQPTFGSGVDKDEKDSHKIRLGSMNFDGKLLSGQPMTIKNKKSVQVSNERVKPVIDIVGTEAICYPNSECKRGRRVKLASRTTRTLEAAKAHEQTLESLSMLKYTRSPEPSDRFHIQRPMTSINRRPLTAPRPRRRSPHRMLRRPRTVAGFH